LLKRKAVDTKPTQPKKPVNAYNFFSMDFRQKLRGEGTEKDTVRLRAAFFLCVAGYVSRVCRGSRVDNCREAMLGDYDISSATFAACQPC
jgi:hypothetical protein